MTVREISTEESIGRILATPLGSRVMQPEYGSRLFELIDKAVTDEWVLLACDYTYEAIETNESRVSVKNVSIKTGESVAINIEYVEVTTGESKTLSVDLGGEDATA
jgi:phage baseplate assembly protein W